MSVQGSYDGVKIFSATKASDRMHLGDVITEWIGAGREVLAPVHTVVTQSSDSMYHCISVTVFYKYLPAVNDE